MVRMWILWIYDYYLNLIIKRNLQLGVYCPQSVISLWLVTFHSRLWNPKLTDGRRTNGWVSTRWKFDNLPINSFAPRGKSFVHNIHGSAVTHTIHFIDCKILTFKSALNIQLENKQREFVCCCRCHLTFNGSKSFPIAISKINFQLELFWAVPPPRLVLNLPKNIANTINFNLNGAAKKLQHIFARIFAQYLRLLKIEFNLGQIKCAN